MVTAHLTIGLGNNLFQIAAALAASVVDNDTCIFPTWEYDKAFSVPADMLVNDITSPNNVTYHEPHFHYSPIPSAGGNTLALDGYFQSEKYFSNIAERTRDLFSPSLYVKTRLREYEKMLSPLVSIHVRRGDYLNLQQFHPVQPLDYYILAISRFRSDQKFMIFSDDIPWCKTAFGSLPNPERFLYPALHTDYMDLHMMSMCHAGHIIANSSFSWWGAWLDSSLSPVYAPRNWFGPSFSCNDTKDLIPDRWNIL